MGIQIIHGGGAAAFGSGFGKGLNDGIDAEQERLRKEAERDQLAQETVQVVNQSLKPLLEREDAAIPDATPGPVSMVGQGPFALPAFLTPQPNPEQAQFDKLAEGHARAMKGMKNPEMIAAYGKQAAAELEYLNQQRIINTMGRSMQTAIKNGIMTEDELAPFVAGLQSDVVGAYKQFNAFRDERVGEARDQARAGRFLAQVDADSQAFAQDATTTLDPEESAWLKHQAGQLADIKAEMEAAMAFGLSDFDMEGAQARFSKIKNALNPVQERAANEREMEFRSLLDAQERLLSTEFEDGEQRTAMLDDIKNRREALGLPVSAPVLDPDPGEGGANARSTTGASPASAATAKVAEVRQPFRGKDPFKGAKNVEEVDAKVSKSLGLMLERLGGPGAFQLEGDDSVPHDVQMAKAILAKIAEVSQEKPEEAEKLHAELRAFTAAAREAKERIGKAKSAPKSSGLDRAKAMRDDDIGGGGI